MYNNNADMKILFITDCHSQPKALNHIQDALNTGVYDVVLGLGDIVERGTEWQSYIEKLLALFQQNNIPFYTIHGNSDPQEAVVAYREQGISLHGRVVEFQGYKIGGIGGFDELPSASFDISGGILLTHYPPSENPKFEAPASPISTRGVQRGERNSNLFENSEIQTFGNSSPAHAPLIHACGHLHQIARTRRLGRTTVIQAPTTQSGRMTRCSLPSCEIEFFTLNQYNK